MQTPRGGWNDVKVVKAGGKTIEEQIYTMILQIFRK